MLDKKSYVYFVRKIKRLELELQKAQNNIYSKSNKINIVKKDLIFVICDLQNKISQVDSSSKSEFKRIIKLLESTLQRISDENE